MEKRLMMTDEEKERKSEMEVDGHRKSGLE